MFIVPFIYKVSNSNNINIHAINLLTIGGSNLWEEEIGSNLDKNILESNDMYRKGSIISLPNITLCEIDTDKTNIHDFYQWNELPLEDTNTFCWRNFYYFLGDKKESWLNIPSNEKISGNMISIIIQKIIESKTK